MTTRSIQVKINGKFRPGIFPQEVARFFLWCAKNEVDIGKDPFHALGQYLDSLSAWSKREDISIGGTATPEEAL